MIQIPDPNILESCGKTYPQRPHIITCETVYTHEQLRAQVDYCMELWKVALNG